VVDRQPLRRMPDGALIDHVWFIANCGWGQRLVQSKQSRRAPKRAQQKVSCEQCFFRVNLLCALELPEPCATFRPNEAGLRPPQQLRFVFRQERRSRAAWAFPSAQEQAALHA
jgi:hypothetical protein